MSTTPSAAAATARQRLAGVLGTLQQDPNIPPNIVEIASGLAGAIGPLFKLERGDPDMNLFVQARGVLQGTLEKMQGVDQSFPGVAEATQAIAETLRTIFNALKDAGALPGQPAAVPAPAAPAAPPVAAAQPVPPAAPYVAPAQPPQPVAAPAPAPAPAPIAAAQPQPIAPAPAQHNPFAQPQPVAAQFVAPAQPAPAQAQRPASHMAMPAAVATPTGAAMHKAGTPGASVPLGPSGLPRLETEVNVHSESNFFTDFFGDIRNNGGVFVATFHVLPVGAPCEVSLSFPGNLSADIQGKVKFTRNASDGASPGLGISITAASPDAWNLIERFVKKREPIMHDV